MIDNISTAILTIRIHDLLKKIRYDSHSFWMLDLTVMMTPITGNKAFKLALNLDYAIEQGYQGILTFGGAYSNHIYQTAIASKHHGLASIGMIRGNIDDLQNPTLQAARSAEMTLKALSRSDYRRKMNEDFLMRLKADYPNFWIVPEGGSNDLAVSGAAILGRHIRSICEKNGVSTVCLPVGTGGTMAGIIKGISNATDIVGYSALKNAGQAKDIHQWINDETLDKWSLVEEDRWGGFAKWDESLVAFIKSFHKETDVITDMLYVGKMIGRALAEGELNDHSLFIHTGGIQGNKGFNQRFDLDLPC